MNDYTMAIICGPGSLMCLVPLLLLSDCALDAPDERPYFCPPHPDIILFVALSALILIPIILIIRGDKTEGRGRR